MLPKLKTLAELQELSGSHTKHVGRVFSRLTVISQAPFSPSGKPMANCSCTCGNYVTTLYSSIRTGHTKSCGCLNSETTRARSVTHGDTRSATYKVWLAMRRRCERVTSPDYADYGERGITVCSRWSDYANFLADMGSKPPGMSIDRIDNNKGYSPENCRWATPAQQSVNKRNNIFVLFKGERMCLAHGIQAAALPKSSVYLRLASGQSIEMASKGLLQEAK